MIRFPAKTKHLWRLYLLEPRLVPAWGEAREAQWLFSPCLFLFRCALICWNAHSCFNKDLYPLPKQETVIWIGRKRTTPSGLYRSSQSFTHRMTFSCCKGITEMWRVGLIWVHLIKLLSQWYLISVINIHCFHKYMSCSRARVVNPVEEVLSQYKFKKWRRCVSRESLDFRDNGICLVSIPWFSISNGSLKVCLTY